MPIEVSLQQLLNRTQRAYKTIDMRRVLVKQDSSWKNALTVIRLSCKNVADLEGDLRDLKSEHGEVQTNSFRIEFSAGIFLEWADYCDVFQRDEMGLGRSMYLASLTMRRAQGVLKEIDWPCFEAYSGEHCRLLEKKELQREFEARFPFGVYHAINELLEMNFTPSWGLDLAVSAPFYARIKNAEGGGISVMVTVEFHQNIDNLVLDAVAHPAQYPYKTFSDSCREEIKVNESERLNKDLNLWGREILLPKAKLDDYFTVTLRHMKPYPLEIATLGGRL